MMKMLVAILMLFKGEYGSIIDTAFFFFSLSYRTSPTHGSLSRSGLHQPVC